MYAFRYGLVYQFDAPMAAKSATDRLTNAYYDAYGDYYQEIIMSLLSLAADFTARVPSNYTYREVLPGKDDMIEAIIETFPLADVDERSRASEILSPAARAILLVYARKASVRAVREHTPKWVMNGLVALTMGDGKPDTRDSI